MSARSPQWLGRKVIKSRSRVRLKWINGYFQRETVTWSNRSELSGRRALLGPCFEATVPRGKSVIIQRLLLLQSTGYLLGFSNAKQAATNRRNTQHLCFPIMSVLFGLNVWLKLPPNKSYMGDSHLRGVFQKLVKFPCKVENPQRYLWYLQWISNWQHLQPPDLYSLE